MNTTYETTDFSSAAIFDTLKKGFCVGPNAYSEHVKKLEYKKELTKFRPQVGGLDFSEMLKGTTAFLSAIAADDYTTKCIESALLFIAQFTRSQDTGDVILALTAFIQSTRTKSISSGIVTATTEMYSTMFRNIFVQQASMFEQVDDFAQFLEGVRKKIDFSVRLAESPIMLKLHKFLMFCLSNSFCERLGVTFESCGYDKFEAEAIRKVHRGTGNFLWCLFDTCTMFLTQFVKSVKEGSWSSFFHCETSYEKFVDDVFELKRKSHYLANPEPHGFDLFSYRSLLASAYDRGTLIMAKFAGQKESREKSAIKQLLADINLLKSQDISKVSAQRNRPAPFGICVGGGSSLGKTTLIRYMFQYYAKLHKLSASSEHMYTRNCMEKHWNGFRSSAWCILMDDIAALSPKLGTIDPSLNEIICVINNVAYVPEQADLCDKGTTPVLAELVLATTNVLHLNAQAYFSCPIAVQRRLPWVVEVAVRDEYAKNGQLDFSKLDIKDEEFSDWWILKVSKVVPDCTAQMADVNQRGKLELIHTFATIEAFLAWFGKVSMDHKRVQKSIAEQNARTEQIDVCGGCFYPLYSCKCEELAQLCTVCGQKNLVCTCIVEPTPQVVRAARTISGLERQSDSVSTSTALNNIGNASAYYNSNRWYEWTIQDGLDFWYTVKACFWIILGYLPVAFFGGFVCWVTGYYDRFLHTVVRFDWRGAMFRFIFRRMGRRFEESTRDVLPMIKIFTTLTVSSFLITALWNRIAPRFTVIPTCVCEKVIPQEELGEKLGAPYQRQRIKKIISDHEEVIATLNKRLDEIKFFVGDDPLTDMSTLTEETEDVSPSDDTPFFTRASAEGKPPEPDSDARLNVWQRKEYSVTPFDVSPQTLSSANCDPTTFRMALKKALRRVEITGTNGNTKYSGAFAVGGWLYAYNKHALPEGDSWTIKLSREPTADGITSLSVFNLTRSRIYFVPDSDLCFMLLTGQEPQKNLFKFFAKASWDGLEHGELLGMDIHTNQYTVNTVSRIHAEMYDWNNDSSLIDVYIGTSQRPTILGECGSVLWSNSRRGFIIFGIHSAGSVIDNLVLSMPLRQEHVENAMSYFKVPAIQSGVPKFVAPSAPPHVLGPVHYKSPLMFIPQGSALVRGSFIGPRAAPKSRVGPTMLTEAARKFGYVEQGGPPDFRGWRPWSRALSDMVGIQDTFRDDILDHCVECFTADILRNLTEADLARVHVYDVMTAVNGAPGVAFVDGINKGTSAGFPWNRTKRGFFNRIPGVSGLPDAVMYNDEIAAAVDEMLAAYKEGVTVGTIFRGSLKDEVTSFEKIAISKLRMFSGASLPFTIVTRMYFLPLIKLLMTKRYLFESAPGTIAQSEEWDDMYRYLTFFSLLRIIAGDFKAFDKNMAAKLMMCAFQILIAIAIEAGYEGEDLLVLWCIAAEICFPTYDVNGDLIQILGSNPSGHALTVIINGLVNCLYMRYCYTVLSPDHSCAKFKQNVHLMTYGDDNIMGVSENAPWFNHVAISGVLAAHGVTYTMADKTSESIPYINIAQASFLKRTWRYDEDVGKFLCPLEWASIEKSIMGCVHSKSVCPQVQSLDIASSAIDEFFWYGKSVFTFRRQQMIDIVASSGLSEFAPPFKTWEELHDRYKNFQVAPTLEWRTLV